MTAEDRTGGKEQAGERRPGRPADPRESTAPAARQEPQAPVTPQPEYELVDLDTLPSDANPPVIRIEKADGKNHRTFLMILIVGIVLTFTILVDLLGAAFMEPAAWAQLAPEVKEIRTWVFYTAGPIIGFYWRR